MQHLIDGVKKLIEMDKTLEKGGKVEVPKA